MAKTTSDLVGVTMGYESGIFETTPGRYGRTVEFGDISYEDERRDQQDAIFEKLFQLHSIFRDNSVYQINLLNISVPNQRTERVLPEVGENADMARCFNDLIEAQQREGNIGIERRNFVSFSVKASDVDEAEPTLATMRNSVCKAFERMGSTVEPLAGPARFAVLNDLLRGRSETFSMDYGKLAGMRAHARDIVAPAWAAYPAGDPLRRSLRFPNRCAQALWIKDFGNVLSDRAIRSIRALRIPMNISLLFRPMNTAEATRDLRTNIAAIHSEIFNYQAAVAAQSADFTRLPPAMEERESGARELLSFVVDKDQQMELFQGIIVVYAPNPDVLAGYVRQIRDEAATFSIVLEELALRQEEALTSSLPLATPLLPKCYRSLTSGEAAIMVPFSSETVHHSPLRSYYLGQDSVTNNTIFVDPTKTNSPHMWIFGITGSGKGMCMSSILTYNCLRYPRTVYDPDFDEMVNPSNDAPCWVVFDFHGEYVPLARRLGGLVHPLGAGHDTCLNPLDISNEAGALTRKVVQQSIDFFLALMQSIMGRTLEQAERSILDKCLGAAYEPHIGRETRPTLQDLRDGLASYGSERALELAEALEIYVTGSMSAFNGPTSIRYSRHLTVFDCAELGTQMRTFALLCAMQSVRNLVFANYRHGRSTTMVVEEVQTLFDDEEAVTVLVNFMAELRKFGLRMICISQLPDRVLTHPQAKFLFENSSIFVFLANQRINAERIADMFKLSASQTERMDLGVEKGSGLVIVGGAKIAMKNHIPSGNILYELWNTDPDRMARTAPDGADALDPARRALESGSVSFALRMTGADGRITDVALDEADVAALVAGRGERHGG